MNLADMLHAGEGVQQRHHEAARLNRLAAEQGHAEAQFYWGCTCFDGKGSQRSRGKLNLGSMFYYGQGVPQCHHEAARMYHLAAEQGHAEA